MNEILIWDDPWKGTEVKIPDDYEWVESGDHFLTRKVKSLCKERSSKFYIKMKGTRRYSRAVGYYAPQTVVVDAQQAKADTEDKRMAQRQKAAVYRDKQEQQYRNEFAERVMQLFPGIPKGDAESIADRACEVGSERVGRTRQIEFDRKVELAVVAHARHNYTTYDQSLSNLCGEYEYQELRRSIGATVEGIVDGWRKESPDKEKGI